MTGETDPLTQQERSSLTVWTDSFSAQGRQHDGEEGYSLALFIKPETPRDADNVAMIPPADVVKLRALLAEIELREEG